MIRKISITIIAILIFITAIPVVLGQTKTPAPTPTSSQSKEIDKFKEKLASKVAELNRQNQKVVAGVVESADSKTLRIKSEDDGTYDVKIDQDLTKFYLITVAGKKEQKLSDIKKGIYVVLSGPQIDRDIQANQIYQDDQFIADSGRVITVNTTNSSLELKTSTKNKYTLDIEIVTRQQILNIKTLDIERSGFSKIKEGDTIHFIIKKSAQSKSDRASAHKILIIPQEYFNK